MHDRQSLLVLGIVCLKPFRQQHDGPHEASHQGARADQAGLYGNGRLRRHPNGCTNILSAGLQKRSGISGFRLDHA